MYASISCDVNFKYVVLSHIARRIVKYKDNEAGVSCDVELRYVVLRYIARRKV